jgi:hypothetical protein
VPVTNEDRDRTQHREQWVDRQDDHLVNPHARNVPVPDLPAERIQLVRVLAGYASGKWGALTSVNAS